ncbi:DUF1194 domain-containing protein [Rhodoblastus sp.]|uniref:DUF1194 domain-containing protein n=1 Tax=Rhodoblastus sp. TaxID=1962975 RepID=UPI003F98F8AA
MRALLLWLTSALAICSASRVLAQTAPDAPVDVALIVSVDVSGSVNPQRYRLQMDGVAKALEDPSVAAAILGGPRASIMFTMVEWSERAKAVIPWTRLASQADITALAARVRRTRRVAGEFTCLAHMMAYVHDLVVPTLPARAGRVVMDVSGDGIDNCDGDDATGARRDELVTAGLTINGLPINEGDPNAPLRAGAFRAPGRPFENRMLHAGEIQTLEPWYRKYVIGGPAAFLLPAQGYGDFSDAIRQKFTMEISAMPKRPAGPANRPRKSAIARGLAGQS